MTRERNIEIRQINIAMHEPHSPAGYVDLFSKALASKFVLTRGKTGGFLLGSLYGTKTAIKENELQGEIFKFTKIDPNSDWFNTETGKPAEDADTQQISIPDNLQPNLERIPFVFFPKEHQLFFVSRDRTKTLGPSVAETLFQKLFEHISIQHQLPTVEVTVVPDETAVSKVLNIHHLSKVIFEFKRPNADDVSGVLRSVQDKMKRRRVNRQIEIMTSTDSDGILPDDEMKTLAKVAAKNGHVESYGHDAEGKRVEESTKGKPALFIETLNESVENIFDVIRRMVK